MVTSLERESLFDGWDVFVGDVRVHLTNATYLDEGGDAEVHRIDSERSVKIYKAPERAGELQNKLTILREKSPTFHPSVVAPQELAFRSDNQTIVGFSMKFLPSARKLEDYFWQPEVSREEEKFDQQAANMLYDISDGLKAIHRSRVVVGDLKPDNVLVSKGKAFVVDFDSASLLPEYPADSYTPEYVDPRLKSDPQSAGPFAFDPESDWWALGVIAFEMFLGTQPWTGVHRKLRSKEARAFNYSVVGFDKDVKVPPTMRSIEWFNDRPELKRYFQNLFSPDVFARYSIDYVLERYFPRPRIREEFLYVPPAAKKVVHSRPKFESQLERFTSTVVRDIEAETSRTIRVRRAANDDTRNQFLEFMLGISN
jgi:serine/threonine protein kinase